MLQDPKAMFALMKEKLYTPVVGDILDAMGYTHQFLPPNIRPLKDDMKLAGFACTILEHDVFGPQKKPFGLRLRYLFPGFLLCLFPTFSRLISSVTFAFKST